MQHKPSRGLSNTSECLDLKTFHGLLLGVNTNNLNGLLLDTPKKAICQTGTSAGFGHHKQVTLGLLTQTSLNKPIHCA